MNSTESAHTINTLYKPFPYLEQYLKIICPCKNFGVPCKLQLTYWKGKKSN